MFRHICHRIRGYRITTQTQDVSDKPLEARFHNKKRCFA